MKQTYTASILSSQLQKYHAVERVQNVSLFQYIIWWSLFAKSTQTWKRTHTFQVNDDTIFCVLLPNNT